MTVLDASKLQEYKATRSVAYKVGVTLFWLCMVETSVVALAEWRSAILI